MVRTEALRVPTAMVQMIAEIDEFKGAWHAGANRRFIENLNVEGQLVYQEIFNNFTAMEITEEVIKHLHTLLLEDSLKEKHYQGAYKKSPNHVEGFDEKGRSIGVVFETALPEEVADKMQALLGWLRSALFDKSLHSLITIGIFIVIFLSIQPFQDSNGQLAWVLSILLLMKAGYHYVAYASLDSIIEDQKESYYLALRKTQQSLHHEQTDWLPWLNFFLQMLLKQKRWVESQVIPLQSLPLQLPQLSSLILENVQTYAKLTTAEIVRLTKANRNTIKKHLERLVGDDLLRRHGKGKGTWYTAV
jgi:Fic family protein